MKIKGFDENLCCRGMQYEVGKEYKTDYTKDELQTCSDTVLHYCDSLQKVHSFYRCHDEDKNRFCEIEVLGDEVADVDGSKHGSNHIKIIREIVGEELKQLKGLINGNTGIFNSGDRNSGDFNSGYRNSGDFNSGYCNSGDRNSGDYNSGYRNSGDRNSGDFNSGYRNSGDFNSGYCNSGVFNSGSFSNGVFCTDTPDIKIFDMDSGMSLRDFYRSKYWDAICSSEFNLTKWVWYTDEEMKKDKDKESQRGYLKQIPYKEACENWWNNMTNNNKKIIKSMPNFNAEIFKEVTGIEI